MLINVENSSLNLLLNACFYAMALVALASVVPWRLKGGRNRWALWLPVAGIAFYGVYESAMPSRWDIRVDLLLIAPMLLVTALAWIVRALLVRRERGG